MAGHLGGVVVDEVAKPVMRDAPQVGPIPQRANRRLFVLGKDAAGAQADDIGELVFSGGSGLRFHACYCPSTVKQQRARPAASKRAPELARPDPRPAWAGRRRTPPLQSPLSSRGSVCG